MEVVLGIDSFPYEYKQHGGVGGTVYDAVVYDAAPYESGLNDKIPTKIREGQFEDSLVLDRDGFSVVAEPCAYCDINASQASRIIPLEPRNQTFILLPDTLSCCP